MEPALIENPRLNLFAEALREWASALRPDTAGTRPRCPRGRKHPGPLAARRPPPSLENGLWPPDGSPPPLPEPGPGLVRRRDAGRHRPLGWSWDDIGQALQSYPDARSFRDWWPQGRPQPLPTPDIPLPVPFVPRTEQALLQSLLTHQATWRSARHKALILSGVAGIGKTTLLAALARDDSLRRHFRNGILWLEGTGTDLLEQATLQVGLRDSPTTRAGEWARWAGDPNRRLLVILDDALPDENLDDLIAPTGPQVVFALTTQKAPEIRPPWNADPLHQIAEVLLQGMREEEGFALIQRVQGHPSENRSGRRRAGWPTSWAQHPEASAWPQEWPESNRAEKQKPRGAAGRPCWPSWKRRG